jgi:adenylate kinase family enzyme
MEPGVRRVAIIGPAGAGKSELARLLGERTGLPVVHLDPIFWRSDWSPAPRHEACRLLAEVVGRDRWILDGNFLDADGGERLVRAEAVVFLDLPRRTCIRRVLWRRVRNRGRSRPDLPPGAREGLDRELLRWIWNYGRTDRPIVLDLLARVQPDVAVHRLRTPSDVRRFLAAH